MIIIVSVLVGGLVAGFVLGLMYAKRVKKALSSKIDA